MIIVLKDKAEAYAQHFTFCPELAGKAKRRQEGQSYRHGEVKGEKVGGWGDKLHGCSYMMQDSSATLNKYTSLISKQVAALTA